MSNQPGRSRHARSDTSGFYPSGRARGKGARDGTKYGRSRTSTRSFYVHHTQLLSVAAAIENVRGLHKAVQNKKQAHVNGVAGTAGTA